MELGVGGLWTGDRSKRAPGGRRAAGGQIVYYVPPLASRRQRRRGPGPGKPGGRLARRGPSSRPGPADLPAHRLLPDGAAESVAGPRGPRVPDAPGARSARGGFASVLPSTSGRVEVSSLLPFAAARGACSARDPARAALGEDIDPAGSCSARRPCAAGAAAAWFALWLGPFRPADLKLPCRRPRQVPFDPRAGACDEPERPRALPRSPRDSLRRSPSRP